MANSWMAFRAASNDTSGVEFASLVAILDLSCIDLSYLTSNLFGFVENARQLGRIKGQQFHNFCLLRDPHPPSSLFYLSSVLGKNF